MAVPYKIVLFICLFVAFSSFFYYMRKNRILKKTIREAYKRIDDSSANRIRTQHQSAQVPKGYFGKKLYQLEQRYIYSGISRKLPGLSVEIWLLLIFLTAVGVYIVCFIITRAFLKSLIIMVGYIGLIFLLESFLIMRNYKAVDKELINFLNMISNFSLTNGEITSIFHKISRYLTQPLRAELEDCYYKAYTTGNNREALQELNARIEHPMFKEIITNLISCISYSANYKEVINTFRDIIREEQKGQKDRRTIGATAVSTMVMMTMGLVLSLYIADGMIQNSIWHIFLNTMGGNIAFVIIVLCYLYFAWKVWTIDR